MKFVVNLLTILLDSVLLFLVAFAFFIRTSSVQTFIAKKATNFLSKELGSRIEIDQVAIVFIDRVALNGVYIEDLEGDTLANIKTLYAKINAFDLAMNTFTLENVRMQDGHIKLKRSAPTGDYNYGFLVDYFSSSSSSETEKLGLHLQRLELANVHFQYDDMRKSHSPYGMDWDHLDFKDVYLDAGQLNIDGTEIRTKINHFSAKEKCGFVLSDFEAKASVGYNGILLDKFTFSTPLSKASFSKLHMKTTGLSDILSFVDSVQFDAVILPSDISLKDVSYFASALEGMDQKVNLTGRVTENVNKLKISEFTLKTGQKSIVQGTIRLPNFDQLEKTFFQEELSYAYVDLNDLSRIKMPKDTEIKYLQFDDLVQHFGHFEGKKVKLDGFYNQFVLSAKEINTSLGKVQLDNGILFKENPVNHSFFFQKSEASEYDVKVVDFNLAGLLDDSNFGQLDGTFFFSGEAFSWQNIRFDLLEGDVNRFDYLGYSYEKVNLREGSLIDNVLTAKVDVKDDNLNLQYDGYIDFNENQHMVFSIDLTRAVLDNLGLTKVENSKLQSKFSVDLIGTDAQNISGLVKLEGLVYQEGEKEFDIPALSIRVKRGQLEDILNIESELANLDIKGKVDFNRIGASFQDQLSLILPAVFKPVEKRKGAVASKNHFTYDIQIKELNEFLGIFVPHLYVEPGTHIGGNYDEKTQNFSLNVQSELIQYENFKGRGIDVIQSVSGNRLSVECLVKKFDLNDSVSVNNLTFNANGTRDVFQSKLDWNPESLNESAINWETTVYAPTDLKFVLQPSFLTLKEKRWDVKNSSEIRLSDGVASVKDFLFERGEQFISVNGKVARNAQDKLRLKVSHLNLADFGVFLQTPMELEGEVNGFAEITDPFESFGYNGDASIKNLVINKEVVGDVFVQSEWQKGNDGINLNGDLIYRNTQTFNFEGAYYLNREKDNLDFSLKFDDTDIQFANAFLDPQVVRDIRGRLNGKIAVKGTPDKPKLSGKVDLSGANAYIGILGVNIKTRGVIKIDSDGFYMDNIPVIDEEGNAGSIVGSIYHNNFSDWNFDLAFNLEDDAINKDPRYAWKVLPLKRFLGLNTSYKEGEYYYGKGYVTGFVNINGYADNLSITTNLRTEKGTSIYFPMYGTSEIDNEESFIQFVNKDTTIQLPTPQIDFTGVDLDLNFDITTDAKIKIIFDEKLGDEISAEGTGKIAMRLNNIGDLTLNGTYVVREGVYNFAMGPVKQNFYIQEGGYITWTGDPYNANLNISSYYKVTADLAEISSDQLSNQGSSNQEIFCYLDITESLIKPSIQFDIQAPRATESGKALLNRIKSDPEELNRQFFSLLLWKRFQPLKGNAAGGGGAALDLAANQINSMLSQLSESYKLAVNLDANALTGDRSFEFGVSKEFLDNRLILTGSFGVENANNQAVNQSQNYLIGDVNLEYLLNEAGTFRINIFNESNQNRVIQDNNQGLFKQGVGLHYQEDFNNFHDFKMIQYFLDVFRKKGKKRYPVKKNRTQTKVPSKN